MSFLQQNIDSVAEMVDRMEKKKFFFAWRYVACIATMAALPFLCTYIMHTEGIYRNSFLISALVLSMSAVGYMGATVILWREGPTTRDVDNLIRKTQAQLYIADKWIEECENNIKRVDATANQRSELLLKLEGDLAASEIVIAAQKDEIAKLRPQEAPKPHFSEGLSPYPSRSH